MKESAQSALLAVKGIGRTVRVGKLPEHVEMNDRLGDEEHDAKFREER